MLRLFSAAFAMLFVGFTGYYAGAACAFVNCIPADVMATVVGDSGFSCHFYNEQQAISAWSEIPNMGVPANYPGTVSVTMRSPLCCTPYCTEGLPSRAWDNLSDPLCPEDTRHKTVGKKFCETPE